MTDYKGGAGDGIRIRALQKQRERESKEIKARMEKIKEEESAPKVKTINEKFASRSESIDEMFTQETVGLVRVDDFRKKRETLEQEEARKRKKEEEIEKSKQPKKPRAEVSKLSFALDDEEEEANGDGSVEESKSPDSGKRNQSFGKDPKVDTTFLPDKEREEQEARERERLKEEWLKEQERIKAQPLSITYSYWDGSGHRRQITVKKGTSVEQLLEQVRQEFKELRAVSAENLMFIKEDLIIPQELTFYDLIVSKARGKSGPLFNWDVHDDIRLVNDATVEKDESHAAKVVERRWYERNKHIFPASRWEVYDPSVARDKYTIHDRLAKH
jgi:protein FAM50